MKISPWTSRWSLWLATLLLTTTAVMSDETDIYFSQYTTANPNILFVLDNSGSMNCTDPATGALIPACLRNGKSRMQMLQSAFSAVMTAAPSNLNIGLMRYGGHGEFAANGVSFPVKPLELDPDGNGSAMSIIQASIPPGQDNLPNPTGENQSVREFLKDVTNSWSAQGYTPIVDALYEAARYYRGEDVFWGRLLPDYVRAAHPASYTGTLAWNANTNCTAPSTCKREWGECTGIVDEPSCHPEMVDDCNWDVVAHDQCCVAYHGVDEAGNPTGPYCSSNDCPRYGCTDTPHKVELTICNQSYCYGALEGSAVYKSPIEYACQSNYIVLMSDGRPEYPGWAGGINVSPPSMDSVKTMIGGGCANSPNGYQSGTCGPELTKYLLQHDQAPSLDGDQLIQTFTIGFGLEDTAATDYLKALANVDDGSVAVNDEAGLKIAFQNILRRVQMDNAPKKSQLTGASVAQAIPENEIQQPMATLNKEEQGLFASAFNPFNYWHSLAAGGFFDASDTTTLINAFNSIINKVTASASSFSSPSYQIDNTMLAHDEYVYIPVFDRSQLPLWPGNLKKFKRDSTGKLIDKNGLAATDSKGIFLDSAQDLWSNTLDGKDVTKGGAANKLPLPDNRKLYTDLSEPSIGSPVELINTANALDKANTSITKTLLGNASMTDAYRDSLLDFARGKKPDGTPRRHMGDMLNGKPQLVNYGASTYILANTNEGYLHAIDASTGVEQWAFMPKTLLANVDVFFQNNLPKKHVSGIDGGLNVWRVQYDSNSDGEIGGADDYKTYLYFGLRQGGREYYMLDITDKNMPKVVWHITNSMTGFTELGQTWSKPALAKMRIAANSPENTTNHANKLVDVLIFGGGYDPVKNNENTTTPAYTRAADTMGRDVFIIRADTGELIWSLRANVSGASSKLLDSIPGDIRVLDMDRNGALDRLYFADTGGHVWRVDMDVDVGDGLPAGADTLYNYTKARLSEFATLSGTGLNKRMFFYEPDVALMTVGGKTVMTLAIGSGYRTRPLNQGDDRFYVMIDRNPYAKAPDTSIFPMTEDAKLVSLTNADGSDNTAKIGAGKTLLTDTTLNGWYYDLPNLGEKVLAPAVTVLNKVVFTSFSSAAGTSTDPCEAPPNSARAYVLDLLSGSAVANLDRSGDGSKDRSVVAGVNEILDAAQIVFHSPAATDGTACTATDCQNQYVEIRVGKMNLPLVDNSNTSATDAGKLDIGEFLPRIFWRDDSVSAH